MSEEDLAKNGSEPSGSVRNARPLSGGVLTQGILRLSSHIFDSCFCHQILDSFSQAPPLSPA